MSDLKVEMLSGAPDWNACLNAARNTAGKVPLDKEPSEEWKLRMLYAEHSPIRELVYRWKWINLPYWVSVHLVRHVTAQHFVKSQRSDRTGVPRDQLPQGALVDHQITCNAQALINISRKRLCNQASPETRKAWKMALDEIAKVDPLVVKVCKPECEYRGGCPELKCCGRKPPLPELAKDNLELKEEVSWYSVKEHKPPTEVELLMLFIYPNGIRHIDEDSFVEDADGHLSCREITSFPQYWAHTIKGPVFELIGEVQSDTMFQVNQMS